MELDYTLIITWMPLFLDYNQIIRLCFEPCSAAVYMYCAIADVRAASKREQTGSSCTMPLFGKGNTAGKKEGRLSLDRRQRLERELRKKEKEENEVDDEEAAAVAVESAAAFTL